MLTRELRLVLLEQSLEQPMAGKVGILLTQNILSFSSCHLPIVTTDGRWEIFPQLLPRRPTED